MGLVARGPALPPALRPRRAVLPEAPAWLLLGGPGGGKTCLAAARAAALGLPVLWLAGTPGDLAGFAAWLGLGAEAAPAELVAALAARADGSLVALDALDDAATDPATAAFLKAWLADAPLPTVATAREPLGLPLARAIALGRLRVAEGRATWLDAAETATWLDPGASAHTKSTGLAMDGTPAFGAAPLSGHAADRGLQGWPLGVDAVVAGASSEELEALVAEEWLALLPPSRAGLLALADPLDAAARAALQVTDAEHAQLVRQGLLDPTTGAWHPLAAPLLRRAWRAAAGPEPDPAAIAGAEALKRAGDLGGLGRWLAALPPAWLDAAPALLRLDGAARQAAGDYPAAAARYRAAEARASQAQDPAAAFGALGDLLHLHWTREDLQAFAAVAAEIAPLAPHAAPGEHAEYLNNLACWRWGEGDEAEARALFVRVLDVPALGDAQLASVQQFAAINLGVLAQEAGRFDEAARGFRRALALAEATPLKPSVPRGARLYLAGVALALGDRHAAREAFEALAASPFPAEEHYRRGEFATLEGDYHLLTGDHQAAEACYRAALDLFGRAQMATCADAGLALVRLARIHRRRGEGPAAARALAEALPLVAPWPRYAAVAHLERALTAADDPSAAEAALQDARQALQAVEAGHLAAAIALASAALAARAGRTEEARTRLDAAIPAMLAGPYYYQAIAQRELAPDLWALLAATGRADVLAALEARFPAASANIRAELAARPAPTPLPPPPAPALAIRLLGPLDVRVAGEPVPAWPRKKAKALLALLAMHPDGLGREVLADRLFPDLGFEEGLHQLEVALSTLRKALEPTLAPRQKSRWLDTVDRKIRLRHELAELELDLPAFEAACDAGRRSADEAAWARAADLYRGDLLDEPALQDGFEAERTRLRARALEALGALSQAHEAAERFEPARAAAERILALDPADEAAHRTLLRIYLRFGARDQARRQLALCEAALREGLDAEPDDETMALAAQLR